ncbi:MAG: heavy-metal-associated domain-containing protein [Chloroflexi bacterium]|nr:heavy-metal-associated domain-containing protein [Chloroflexota bacterium]
MKLMRVLMVVFAVLVATACTSSAGQQRDGRIIQPGTSAKEVVLEIPTITCTGCRPRVEASARSVPGVIDVKFDRDQKVTVVYDPEQTNPAAIIAAIEKRGDKATVISG